MIQTGGSMKKITWITVGVVMVLLVSGETAATAAEQNQKSEQDSKEPIVVDYDYIDDYEPCMMYALDGAELFQTADINRKVGELKAGDSIYCYQKTDNGFYYGTTDRNNTYYVHEDAVSESENNKDKAIVLATGEQNGEEGILFICTSFGELESVALYNPANDMTVILKGMGMYDYESYDFLRPGDSEIEMTKTYLNGQVIEQTFQIESGAKQVGIYDDGSFDQSWIEIDGNFIYE